MTPIALAAVSLFAALALWVAVTDAENPTSTRDVPLALRIEATGVPEGLAVRNIAPDAVRVRVRATEEDLDQLTAANFRVTVDMTGIRDSESTRPVVVEVLGVEDVDIVEQSAIFVEVTLENETTKNVPVRVNRVGTQASGFLLATIEANPDEVEVSGAASLVALVDAAVVDINLTGLRSRIQQQYNLTPRDVSGADLPRVVVDPGSAEIILSIVQQNSPITLPVAADLQGRIADGFNITNISTDPQTVLAEGSIAVLQGVSRLLTEPVDLNGARETITRSVRLRVPTGMQVQQDTINVTVSVEPSRGERAITVAPIVENIPENLNPVLQTSSLTVYVRGDTPVLNGLTAGSFEALVDLEGLAEGIHLLPVVIELPPDVELVSVQPVQVVVALRP